MPTEEASKKRYTEALGQLPQLLDTSRYEYPQSNIDKIESFLALYNIKRPSDLMNKDGFLYQEAPLTRFEILTSFAGLMMALCPNSIALYHLSQALIYNLKSVIGIYDDKSFKLNDMIVSACKILKDAGRMLIASRNRMEDDDQYEMQFYKLFTTWDIPPKIVELLFGRDDFLGGFEKEIAQHLADSECNYNLSEWIKHPKYWGLIEPLLDARATHIGKVEKKEWIAFFRSQGDRPLPLLTLLDGLNLEEMSPKLLSNVITHISKLHPIAMLSLSTVSEPTLRQFSCTREDILNISKTAWLVGRAAKIILNANQSLLEDPKLMLQIVINQRALIEKEENRHFSDMNNNYLASIKKAIAQLKKPGRNREIVLAAVKRDGLKLEHAGYLKSDKEIVLAAVENNGHALTFAPITLKDDNEIVEAATRNNTDAFEYASSRLKDDYGFVMSLVESNGYALTDASPRLKNDRAIVIAAIKTTDGCALYNASDTLRKDKKIAMMALNSSINEYGHYDEEVFSYWHDELKGDVDLVMEAAKKEIDVLYYAAEAVKDNSDAMLELVQHNAGAFKYLSSRLQQDKQIIIAVSEKGNDNDNDAYLSCEDQDEDEDEAAYLSCEGGYLSCSF